MLALIRSFLFVFSGIDPARKEKVVRQLAKESVIPGAVGIASQALFMPAFYYSLWYLLKPADLLYWVIPLYFSFAIDAVVLFFADKLLVKNKYGQFIWVAMVIPNGLLPGLCAVYYYPGLETQAIFFFALIVVGLCAIATAVFATNHQSYKAFVVTLLFPGTTYLVTERADDFALSMLGYFGFAFAIVGSGLNQMMFFSRVKLTLVNHSLEEAKNAIEQAKLQQDGDYFLISLLVDPLAKILPSEKSIHIDSFIREKKKFEFKSKKREIGGDINISDRIELQGEKFEVVMNADAMGKSIQGAGGALVLGSVFQSILHRSKTDKSLSGKKPERWLRHAYLELHQIFERFEGMMSISMVLALVSEKGFVYFINAEHPFVAVYRDGQARYVEKAIHLPKLGSLVPVAKFVVSTYRLKAGDTLLIGSDGRDDINLGTVDGKRNINSDPQLFLDLVIEAQAKPEAIFAAAEAKGEITDDFSLITISRQP